MLRLFKRFAHTISPKSKKDKRLIAAITSIVGSKPFNIKPYHIATQHTSVAKKTTSGIKESNERLEYLGDAILGSIVAEYLFKKYPFKDEGFLTEIRSRIVNRESLNLLGKKIGVNKIVEYDNPKGGFLSHKSIYGDTLEALIGAVYLDKGYKFCQSFVIRKLISPHYDLDELTSGTTNYKSLIIEWAQRSGSQLIFEVKSIKEIKNRKEFEISLVVEDEPVSLGYGPNKKKAEQDAAFRACETLNLI